MKIITDYPVIYSNACGFCGFSNLDGKSSIKEVMDFQNWANNKGYKDKDGQSLKVDGIFGSRTSYVYTNFGKEYESERLGKNEQKIIDSNNQEVKQQQDKGSKTMSKTAKIIIGLSILVIFGAITYRILNKK